MGDLVKIHNNLEKMIDEKESAMPKNFNKTRFIQNCMVVLQDTKGIEKVESKSVARTLLKGAFLGLDFYNKECYAIPYGNNLQFQTDYKGEKKLAKLYSINPIKDIYAKLVKKGDEFSETIISGQQVINFNPLPFNDGEIIGAFAVVLYEDGSMMYEAMSVKDINEVKRNYSKQANGQAWTKSFGEMCKKTVYRRLCKHIELNFDSIEQAKEWQESSDFEVNKKKKEVVSASTLDIDEAIDAEATEVLPAEE